MGTTTNKLQAILNSKEAIKLAIESKGVSNVGEVLSDYPNKITEIPTGSPDAVLYSPQTLTEEQQEQARKNINSAPGYYNQNGFVISPLGISVNGLRYIAYKEELNSTICYILTLTRCLKMDFETYEVFWDVNIEGTNGQWHKSGEYLRIIDDIVYVILCNYNTKGMHLVQLSDVDGSTIMNIDIPITVNYGYGTFNTRGCPLITKEKIYDIDETEKAIVSFDLTTFEISVLKNVDLMNDYLRTQLLWITNENNKSELVMLSFCKNAIYIIRQDGSIITINVEQNFTQGSWLIYKLNLQTLHITYLLAYRIFIGQLTDNGDGTFSANFSAKKSNLLLRWNDIFSNSPSNMFPYASLSIIDPYNQIIEHLLISKVGAQFQSFSNIVLLADYISCSNILPCNIIKTAL